MYWPQRVLAVVMVEILAPVKCYSEINTKASIGFIPLEAL